ncbi:M23 family metallopeptidase [Bacteroides acidifaciens]|uniref:M23 family metallopeptidase n=1 Tax=Bacteroides acidifaciens TaxID=85831 RepID=UPI002557F9D1|nr:M23 family metallopeptidase [Bacteroides acidifaciens]
MRKILLLIISCVSFCTMPVQAQFNTIAKTPERYKVEALQEGMKKQEPTPESAAPVQETSVKSADKRKQSWIDRYLSVSYPLQRIRITSPYGYRKDPFTGKRKFHGGIDLHARGEQALAMMEGVVVKVGQDKTSGKYVTLRHGNYTVSYCHLSRVLTEKGRVVHPRDVVGITGSTGRSTGEHLHITCKLNGKSVNPSVLFDYIKSMQQECVSALARL